MCPPPDGWSTTHPRGAEAIAPPPTRGDADGLGEADADAIDALAEDPVDGASGCTDALPQAMMSMKKAQQIPRAPSRKTQAPRERRASTDRPSTIISACAGPVA
jgi:hypothetical protein